MEIINVPTGKIFMSKFEKGYLEFLSLADYGQKNNIKADFLGLKKEINGVKHQKMLPLSKKWVITISTQYGCSMGCKFCDVPKVGKGTNASFRDLVNQVMIAMGDGISSGQLGECERVNLHYARMGEPTFNMNVIESAKWFKEYFDLLDHKYHPVVSTMMPKNNKHLVHFLDGWMGIKNNILEGEAGLQLSINTTNEEERQRIFNCNALTLEKISEIVNKYSVAGRKITLNFAIHDNTEIDAKKLSNLFDTKRFLVKITPIHNTYTSGKNNLQLTKGYHSYEPYKKHEEELKKYGFDVIVFIPSIEEDKSMITCGNAILSCRNNTDNVKKWKESFENFLQQEIDMQKKIKFIMEDI